MFKKIKSIFMRPKLYSVRKEARESDYPLPGIKEEPPFIGKWAVLSYYIPGDLMHPEDAKKYLECKNDGELLYECTKEETEWVSITNDKGEVFRVNPYRVLWVPSPDFALGQEVETTNGTHRVGWISLRSWHYKEKRFGYFIDIVKGHGKNARHKRRYWSDDLTTKSAGR